MNALWFFTLSDYSVYLNVYLFIYDGVIHVMFTKPIKLLLCSPTLGNILRTLCGFGFLAF